MASKTTNLNLLKPAAGDKFSITGSEGYNNNMDKIDAAIGQLNSDSLKIRATKKMSSGSWQNNGTVINIDTGIGFVSGDICVSNIDNDTTSDLSLTPFVLNKKWYISSSCAKEGGGGPEMMCITILNTII